MNNVLWTNASRIKYSAHNRAHTCKMKLQTAGKLKPFTVRTYKGKTSWDACSENIAGEVISMAWQREILKKIQVL